MFLEWSVLKFTIHEMAKNVVLGNRDYSSMKSPSQIGQGL
jgi:hypothetical protein